MPCVHHYIGSSDSRVLAFNEIREIPVDEYEVFKDLMPLEIVLVKVCTKCGNIIYSIIQNPLREKYLETADPVEVAKELVELLKLYPNHYAKTANTFIRMLSGLISKNPNGELIELLSQFQELLNAE